MFHIDLNKLKSDRKSGRLCIIVGIVTAFAIIAALVVQSFFKSTLDTKTISTKVAIMENTNSDGEKMYTPVYTYQVNDQEYTCKSNLSTSIKPSAENGTVYYDSKNPEKCMTEATSATLPIFYLFLLFPLGIIVYGVYIYQKAQNVYNRLKNLIKTGKLIENLSFYTEPKEIKTKAYVCVDYQGHKLRTDYPQKAERIRKHETIDLIIDESNPKLYYLDFNIRNKDQKPIKG